MKQIFITAILVPLLLPSLSFGASLRSLEKRLNNLEDELLITQEENKDLTRELNNSMKLSGYVDIEYISSSKASDSPGFRMHHTSLFFEKKLTDKVHFFSEIEFEDAPKFEAEGFLPDGSAELVDGKANRTFKAQEGKLFLEAVNFSYLWDSKANFRLGRFYTPAGLWSIDHYPPFVPTQERPQHIRRIFPQLVDGVMAYGTFGVLGDTFLNYDIYAGNGEGNTAKKDKNDDKAVGVKVALLLPHLSYLEVGGTFYTDVLNVDENGDATDKTALGIHAKAKMWGLTLQFEYAEGENKKLGVTKKSEAYYLQAYYDIGKFTVGGRHDYYDDDTSAGSDSSKYGTINSIFADYHVNESIVVKLEHHLVDVEDGTSNNKTIVSVVAYLGN